MKQTANICLTVLLVIVLSPMALAMGGPPQSETPQENPIQVPTYQQFSAQQAAQQAQPSVETTTTGTASTEEIEKATIELIELEAKLDRQDEYLDLLSKKMVKANAEGDSSKLIELKAREKEAVSRRKAISDKIEALKNKYPELRTAQAPQASEKPQVEIAPIRPLPPAVSAPTTPNIVYHEVEMGDTLMSVSRKYFNSPEYFRQIADANNITDLSYLPQGMTLKIDLNWARGGVVAAPVKAKPKAVAKILASASGVVYHVVAAHETLMSISRKYFNSASYYKEIMSLNGLADPSQLKVGMRLKIDMSIKGKIPAQNL